MGSGLGSDDGGAAQKGCRPASHPDPVPPVEGEGDLTPSSRTGALGGGDVGSAHPFGALRSVNSR